MARRVWAPWVRFVAVKLHAPSPSAVAVPSVPRSEWTVTTAFGLVRPVMVTAVRLVSLSVALVPESEGPVSPSMVVTGGTESFSTITAAEGVERLPTTSMATSRTSWRPSLIAGQGWLLKAPAWKTGPASTPSTVKTSVSPGPPAAPET
ncbi:hypothetical protein D3C72_1025770 [compost metagenome]